MVRKEICALACLGALSGTAMAQSSVTLYGIVDTTLRYTSHADASGGSRFQMADGLVTGDRIGFRGVEDLGGGNKAIFTLENGFSPANGTLLQGSREFGRQAFVGLSGQWGTLTMGRQYTVTHEMIASHDVFALANYAPDGMVGGNYSGARLDNTVKYRGAYGPFYFSAAFSFGNVPGDFHSGSSPAVGIGYGSGPWNFSVTYQVMNEVTTAFYGLPIDPSQQKVWSATGTYTFSNSQLYFGYVGSRVDVADYRDDTGYLAVNQQVFPWLHFIAAGWFDHMRHADQSGNRWTGTLMLDYLLSKRTDVYVEADYTKLSGVWTSTAAQPQFQTPFFGYSSQVGANIGLRHTF